MNNRKIQIYKATQLSKNPEYMQKYFLLQYLVPIFRKIKKTSNSQWKKLFNNYINNAKG